MFKKGMVTIALAATVVVGGTAWIANAVTPQTSTTDEIPATDAVTDTVATLADAGLMADDAAFAGAFFLALTSTSDAMVVHYTAGVEGEDELLAMVDGVSGTTPLPVSAEPTSVDFRSLDDLARALSDPASDLSKSLQLDTQEYVDVDQTNGVVTVHFADVADFPPGAIAHADGTYTLSAEGVEVFLVDTE